MAKKTTASRKRSGATENPNTPVAAETEGGVPFAEREPVTVNPNNPVAPETEGGVPFAGDGD